MLYYSKDNPNKALISTLGMSMSNSIKYPTLLSKEKETA